MYHWEIKLIHFKNTNRQNVFTQSKTQAECEKEIERERWTEEYLERGKQGERATFKKRRTPHRLLMQHDRVQMRSRRSLTDHIPSFGLPVLSVAFVETRLWLPSGRLSLVRRKGRADGAEHSRHVECGRETVVLSQGCVQSRYNSGSERSMVYKC